MDVSQYLDKDGMMQAAEKTAQAVWEHILYPGLEKLVQDSANVYDDAALALAKEMVEGVIAGIHTPAEPEA